MDDSKSLILETENFKQELVSSFNELIKKYQVPAYFLEPVVAAIYNQVAAAAQQELAKEKSNAEEK